MRIISYLVLLFLSVDGTIASAQTDFAEARSQMVQEINEMVRDTSSYIGKSSLAEDVMAAMAKVPRHEFVPASLHQAAYFNRPLPIGNKQTISQPYIVALMTDLADVDHDSVVLEVGTGSGYQAAVLSQLVKHVYTIEIIDALGKRAERVLSALGYENITVRVGDGYHGWAEHAPFDAVIVTAAPEEIPQPLIEQLKPGGKMVIPVGSQHGVQSLDVIEKDEEGKIKTRNVLPVGFVPLTRNH